MIIKSKIHFAYDLIFIACSVALPILVLSYGFSCWYIICAILIFLMLAADYFIWLVSLKRTFTLDENGCTVKFGKYKKTYRWEDFKTKQIEVYGNYIRRDFSYKTTIILYFKKTLKPRWIQPYNWAALHPFTYIFIHLKSENSDGSFRIYEAEKEVFEKFEEWGVLLEKVDTIRY